MASKTAKKAAGTYVADSVWTLPVVRAWLTAECRHGVLAPHVRRFCESQDEILEHSSVTVESVTDECIHCQIPCRCYDHESDGTFGMEVRFSLDPQSGACRRI